MIIALRIISASMVLGLFLSRSLNKNLFLPIVIALIGFSIVTSEELLNQNFNYSELILNIFIGASQGIIFSLPVLVIDLLSRYFAENLKVDTFRIVVVLALLLQLFKLDFIPYFFSLLIRANNLIKYESGLEQLTTFFLPCLFVFLVAYLFFILVTTLSPSIISKGVVKYTKVILALSLLFFYINNSSSFFYDMMKGVAQQQK